MEGVLTGSEALERVLSDYDFETVLDVGAGEGLHATRFRAAGKRVVTLDRSSHWGGATDQAVDFLAFEPGEPFDVVWCSHVLEHQPNVGLFLRHIFRALKPGGILALTVPPGKHAIVGGHLTIWNSGLLLYNLVVAGFDCRDARVAQYGYNISVIVRKRHAQLPPLLMDRGDIERLAPYFPVHVRQGFDGRIGAVRWTAEPHPHRPAGAAVAGHELSIEAFRNVSVAGSDEDNLHWSAACIGLPGCVCELGVFKGRSLRLLATKLPHRPVFGFDSFTGLPEPWVRSDTSTYDAGHLALAGPPTDLPGNVTLVTGYFSSTLGPWSAARSEPIALLHLDGGLYSSAAEALHHLDPLIASGTVIVFAELCDWRDSGVYPRWPEGKWRALNEWLQRTGRKVRLLSRGRDFAGAIVVA